MSQNANIAGPTNWRDKTVFTTGEVAEICQISQQTVIRCFDSGKLNGFRVPGSKFRRIPRESLLEFMAAHNIPLEVLGGGKRRILVVDDDPDILDMLEEILGSDGRYDVRTASNGFDAGALSQSFKPEVILLDFMLPDINGNVVCQRIRENAELANTKIIVVSGAADKSEVDALMAAGADEFVQKPFEVEKLLSRIAEMLAA